MTENNVKIGDMFYSMWGYEQTNVDFYEVVKVTAKFVTLREVNTVKTENKMFTGHAAPIPGSYRNDETIRRKVLDYGREPLVSITSYANAYLWDGKAKQFSTYA